MSMPSLYELIALLLVLLALALTFLSFAHLKQLRKKQEEARKETHLLIKALRNENHAMGSGSIGMGHRLVEVEKRLNNTMERQMEIEQRDPGTLPYTYAVRLVEMGASVDDLVQNCGLARVEAELITLVHTELKAQREQPDPEEHYSIN